MTPLEAREPLPDGMSSGSLASSGDDHGLDPRTDDRLMGGSFSLATSAGPLSPSLPGPAVYVRAGQTVFVSSEDAPHVTIQVGRVEGQADEFMWALWKAGMRRLRESKMKATGGVIS